MVVKMTINLLLAIVLSISGVYCPRTEFPSEYPLRSCETDSAYMTFKYEGSFFKFYCSEENPRCSLIETYPRGGGTAENRFEFERAKVEFIAMEDEKLKLLIYPYRQPSHVTWNVTCEFTSLAVAQMFYKRITRDRQSELLHFVKANYLKKSNDLLLARNPNIYLDGFESNITIVIKDDKGDVVLIIPIIAMALTTEPATEMDLYTEIFSDQNRIYKFVFSTSSHASAWYQLLDRLRQIRPVSFYGAFCRPHRHPDVDAFFNEIRREIPR